MYHWKLRDAEEKLREIEGDSPNPACTEGDITLWAAGILAHHLLPVPCTLLVMHSTESCDLQNDPTGAVVCDISHAGLSSPSFQGRHSFCIRFQRQLLSHSPSPSLGFAVLLGDCIFKS